MKFKKIIPFLISFILLFNLNAYSAENFNPKNVINTVKELSKDKYNGRLAGDKGNILSEEYIKNEFQKIGLKPFGDNATFYQSFDVYVPFIEGECSLKVFENGKEIKNYKYGRDFKEFTYGKISDGCFKGKAEYIEDISKSDFSNIKSEIILGTASRYGETMEVYDIDKKLLDKGVKAIILPMSRDLRFRSPYKEQIENNDGLIKLIVSQEVFLDLLNYSKKGYEIEVNGPVKIKKVKANNVIGLLEGRDKNLPPLILSAHFDHVGYDLDGTIYRGAFDNASGTALLIELARVLKSSELNRSIIFAAFNAEEEGLIGSGYFAENPPTNIKDSECINFDMVGTDKDIPLTLLSSSPSRSFIEEIKNLLSTREVNTKTMFDDNSDHASLASKTRGAVTLIHDDLTLIHTPKDTPNVIKEDNILKVYEVLSIYFKSKDIVQDDLVVMVAKDNRDINLILIIVAFSVVLSTFSTAYFLSKKKKR